MKNINKKDRYKNITFIFVKLNVILMNKKMQNSFATKQFALAV